MSKPKTLRTNAGFMDVISLPVVDVESSLKNALAEMKRSKRSGLLGRSGSTIELFTAAGVKGGLTKGKGSTLKDIGGIPLHVGDLTSLAKSTPEPYISSDLLVDSLKKSGKKFGLLSAPTDNKKRAIIYGLGNLSTMYREPGPGEGKKPIRRMSLEFSK
jgi:hypothetical protein